MRTGPERGMAAAGGPSGWYGTKGSGVCAVAAAASGELPVECGWWLLLSMVGVMMVGIGTSSNGEAVWMVGIEGGGFEIAAAGDALVSDGPGGW